MSEQSNNKSMVQQVAPAWNTPVQSIVNPGSEKEWVVEKAAGASLVDTNKLEYIDYFLSGGTQVLGHSPRVVVEAVQEVIWNGTSHGYPVPGETVLAHLIKNALPSIEELRFTANWSDSYNLATSLARQYTRGNLILRIGLTSPGSPELGDKNSFSREGDTLDIDYNDFGALEEVFDTWGHEIAAIVMEPVSTRLGIILPAGGFLNRVREVSLQHGTLLVLDESITGFRPGLGGAQADLGIEPDLTLLGKITGGGYPLGVVGGKKKFMQQAGQTSREFSAGTFLGNPLAVTAGIATLERLGAALLYTSLNHKSRDFLFYLAEISRNNGVVIQSYRSMFSVYFSEKAIASTREAVSRVNQARHERFHEKARENGVFFTPSALGTNFISIAHQAQDLNQTLEVVYQVLKEV